MFLKTLLSISITSKIRFTFNLTNDPDKINNILMKKSFVLAAVLALFAACNRSSDAKNTASENKESLQDTVSSINKIPEIKIQADSVLHLLVPDNGDTLKTDILKQSAPITCNISVSKKGKLMALITTPSGKGNIRFNQIIAPDGTADGPFGKKIEYTATQTGIYKLIIAANLMAEDPYNGEFTLKVLLK